MGTRAIKPAPSAEMNKTVITVAFIALAALGVAGVVTVVLLRPEATTTVISLLVTVLGLATTAVVTFYMLGKQGTVIDTIRTQTNGNTAALIEEIRRQANLLALAPAKPAATVSSATGVIDLSDLTE